jgi:phosphoglycerol transferase MdoB-like AlkP superfamily enzyme
VACTGLLAYTTSPPRIEKWFVFAAGVTTVLALWDLGNVAFRAGQPKGVRPLLTFELFFFAVVLGVDVHLIFGAPSVVVLFVAACSIIGSVVYVATSNGSKEKQVAFLVISLLFTASWLLVPPIIGRVASFLNGWHWLASCKLWNNVIRGRIYPGIHLLAIPFVYYWVDYHVAKKSDEWKEYLPVDKTLFWVGLACLVSGLLFAILDPDNTKKEIKPLYEAGAAAVILLVGNSWYLKVKDQQDEAQL